MNNRWIVTGANGFLGNTIVRRLAENEENEIRALVLPGTDTRPLEGTGCRIFEGDVTQEASLRPLFEGWQGGGLYVIHCAAIVHIKSKCNPQMREVNVNGTKNVAEKALEAKARLVYVSSVHAIPEKPEGETMVETTDFDPDAVEGQYAKTKAEAARYVLDMTRTRGLDACIVHPSGIIGPGDFGRSHLTQLIVDFANGRLKACVRGGYDFVDVRDVADGVINACFHGEAGECYILSNRYVEVKELLDMVSDARGAKRIRLALPMWLANATAPLSEMYYALLRQPPLYTRYSLYTLRSNAHFSNAKAKAALGYKTRNMDETIRDTVRWLEANGRLRR